MLPQQAIFPVTEGTVTDSLCRVMEPNEKKNANTTASTSAIATRRLTKKERFVINLNINNFFQVVH
jgi:hypothetical protein